MSKQNREQNRTQRAAAIQAEASRRERTRKVAITGGILIGLAAIVTAVFLATGGGGSSTSPPATPTNLAVAAGDNTLVLGPSDAPVKVTVYEDFQCPFCRQFETQSRDFLRTDAAEGKVQVTYQPINFLTQDDYSARAVSAWAAILDKGTAKQALAFHDKLFESQPDEQASDKPDSAKLQGWAKDVGVSSSVRDAIDGVDKTVITAVNGVATSASIQQTPSVFVNGKMYGGNLSIDDLVAGLEKTIAAG